jgi:hypothetical protein
MEPARLGNLRTVATGSSEGIVEEVISSKKITIAKNKVGRKAFMNNAPVDNFGTKEYQYVPRLTPKPTPTLYGKAKKLKVTVSSVISWSSWTAPQSHLRNPFRGAVGLIFLSGWTPCQRRRSPAQ